MKNVSQSRSFRSPNIAGYKLISDTIGQKTDPAIYTDQYGQVEDATFFIYHTIPTVANTYPLTTFTTGWLMTIAQNEIKLQPNEILAMTYSYHCISDDENLIIGDFFLENSSMIKELGAAQNIEVRSYATNPRHTIYDKYAKTTDAVGGTYTVATGGASFSVSPAFSYKSWALVHTGSGDERDGRIYFAYNSDGSTYNTVYMGLLKERPDTEILYRS